MTRTLLLVGTRKGAFILDGGADRASWSVSAPLCDGWPIHDLQWDPATGSIYAGGGSPWYGAGGLPQRRPRRDLDPLVGGPDVRRRRAEDPGRLERDPGPRRDLRRRRAGRPVPERRRRARPGRTSRPCATTRAARTGLAARRRRPDLPHDRPPPHGPVPDVGRDQLGRDLRDRGRRGDLGGRATSASAACFQPDPHPETGQCVHKLVMAAGRARPASTSRTTAASTARRDAGRSWDDVSAGLVSEFGFVDGHPPARRRRRPG